MPILPKQRDIFPGDLLEEPADPTGPRGRWLALSTLARAPRAASHVARWIPVPDERMLVDDLRAIKRLVVAVRFLNQGASIELEDVDLEPV